MYIIICASTILRYYIRYTKDHGYTNKSTNENAFVSTKVYNPLLLPADQNCRRTALYLDVVKVAGEFEGRSLLL